jgi:preprotein translocase SecF subunit
MSFNFIKNRFTYYAVAIVLLAISLAAPFAFPMNLGIDMTGGIQAEFDYKDNVDIEAVKKTVEAAKDSVTVSGKHVVNNTMVYRISGENRFVVEAGFSRLEGMNDQAFDEAKTKFRDEISNTLGKSANATLSRYVNVGESFGDYIKKTAYITLVMVILFISLYIAWAFRGSIEGFTSFSFGAVTAVSLFHDVVVAFGLYVITSHFFPEFKIDTFFITAMLTVLGYSINDTIVVMDRIRSNLRLPAAKKQGFGVLIDNSINDTLTRSIFTSLTIVIVLVALFFFGPQAIKGFTLALIFGTIVGAYSSICIAAPLLYDLTKKR